MTQGCKIDKQDGAYFLTFTAVDWINIFKEEKHKLILCDSLNYCVEIKGLEIFAYVIMSTHMHLLAASSKNNLSNIVRDFKKFTCGKIIISLKQENSAESIKKLNAFKVAAEKHTRNKKFQLWQQNNHPEEVNSPKFTLSKIKYIYNNPVEAGLVDRPQDYLFSSAVDYTGRKGLVNVSLLNLASRF
jgi:putative transposase